MSLAITPVASPDRCLSWVQGLGFRGLRAWCMVHGAWFRNHGSWLRIHVLWLRVERVGVHGSCFLVQDSWFKVSGL